MGDAISDHISELLGGQGQPLIEEGQDNEELDSGLDAEIPGGEAPAATDELQQDPTPPKRNQKVPLAALQEERTRRQELQDQLKAKDDQVRAMEQRFTQFMQLQQQQLQQQQPQTQEPEQPQLPAFIDDPEGYVNGLKAQFEQQLQRQQEYIHQLVQQQQVGSQHQQLARQVSGAEAEFAAKTPDYAQAADYYAQRRVAEFTALGADPVTIQQALQTEYTRLAQLAIQQGKNPAEMLYGLSKAMGYDVGQQPAQQKPPVQGQQYQAQPQPVQQKHVPTTLATTAGATHAPDVEGELTLESVANMSDAEFEKVFEKMRRGSVQRPKF